MTDLYRTPRAAAGQAPATRSARDPDARGEWRRGWPTVLTAATGSGLGIAGLFTYTSGLFVTDLQAAIGLTRGAFGLAFFGATLAMAAALPLAGRIADRAGSRPVAVFGSVMLSAGFAALGTVPASVSGYFVLMLLIGLLGAGSTPLAYTRAVSLAFRRSRGLALGFTQIGIGVAAAVVPPVVASAIARDGWPWGYRLLAVLAAAGVVPALFGLAGRRATARPQTSESRFTPGPLFFRQLAAFTTMALAFAGFLPHFVPMLRDLGLGPAQAARFAAIIGLSVIGSRALIGYLADRVHAPWLAAVVCLLAAAGCSALSIGGLAMATAAAVAFGMAMGAEADLVGFLTARYFPLSVYGRAYALQYAAFSVAAGASPAWIGLLHDRTGDYRASLWIAAAALAVAAAIFTTLPRASEPAAGAE